ncbi:MAG: von Willebrand factor type A domain-containing protein [Luteolibacter sp.]
MSASPQPEDPSNEPLFDKNAASPREPKNVRRHSGPPVKLILGSLALLIAIVVFLGFNQPQPPPAAPAPGPLAPVTPPPAGTAVKVTPRTLPALPDRLPINPQPDAFELPIYTETGSMDRISKSIQLHQRLPDPSLIRTEELLNFFSLRPSGPTGVSRGVTLSTEAIACPWKPSSILFLISFKGAADENHLVSATFLPNRANVARYRVLGFQHNPAPAAAGGKTATQLPAKTIATVALEIDPLIPASELGGIQWSVDNQPVPPVPVSYRSDQEPSEDARFAALVCAYSQWLARERPDLVDEQVVAALARESANKEQSPERTALLNLIDRSLNF